ncbi:uncharacterized protein P174DRAFT_445047 [Aspergillus novofumigatus IBT 16806]|uniref:Uncharacterized protein n=1 Tax=Aspergillus novofumigatus (strain IBT 16806) TaxID=1392255 RepID=A0A2I1BXA9_ASPN1|nr:uncharacterized protein P174DRAFT_445047 [Aspergillus novofumigatus IBT 16806]PKX90014.1 hypothetical protein P174DRAFT_445047 [Aspergillus novofumigatus IBT 16806]
MEKSGQCSTWQGALTFCQLWLSERGSVPLLHRFPVDLSSSVLESVRTPWVESNTTAAANRAIEAVFDGAEINGISLPRACIGLSPSRAFRENDISSTSSSLTMSTTGQTSTVAPLLTAGALSSQSLKRRPRGSGLTGSTFVSHHTPTCRTHTTLTPLSTGYSSVSTLPPSEKKHVQPPCAWLDPAIVDYPR